MKKSVIALAALVSSQVYAGTMGTPTTNEFDGFYAGLGTGLFTLFTSDNFSGGISNTPVAKSGDIPYTDSAILFTGQLGYGRMFSEKTYLGVKGSVYYSPLTNTVSRPFSAGGGPILVVGKSEIKTAVKPFYNIDAVLGYEIFPRVLPFVEGGVTIANPTRSYNFSRTYSNLAANTTVLYQPTLKLDGFKTAYNVGIGMNYKPKPNWILTSELVYNNLGSKSGSSGMTVPGTTLTDSQSMTAKNQDVALFASASYLF